MQNLQMNYSTSSLDKAQIGMVVEDMKVRAKEQRWNFERRWYDNNFFDDGKHFRYMSRIQNKIVDLSAASTIWAPMRSIPKASRQIRGVANLLASRQFVPIVYPEKISITQYPPLRQFNPRTGQIDERPNPEYQQARDEAKRVAQSTGHWLTQEYKKQNLLQKLTLMILLAAKHGVSFIQVWPDSIGETIKSMVMDAFEVYTLGHLTELEDEPYVIKSRPRLISEIKADERFDIEQVLKINPDNRYASSEIKEAYSKARYGGFGNPDQAASVIENEAFIKEYLNKDNMARIARQSNSAQILRRRKEGDPIIRQVFVAGNITLRDEYLNIPGYPLVDLRLEPGPMYQVPLIERFIPANKSYDLVVSRVERYLHTMVTGSWSVKTGEPAEPNNSAAGQVFKYNTTPPVQNPIAPIPQFVFNFMELLGGLMEEQGVTTTALGKIPTGVKANAAIESLKESEYANLSIPMDRVKDCVKRISEKMLDYVDDYFVSPQTVYYMEKGEPQYFDVIGATALSKRQELGINDHPADVVPIKRDYRVDIEVESGLGYTRESEKAAARELGDWMVQMTQLGMMSPEVVKIYTQKLFETYRFGSTQELIEALDEGGGMGNLTQTQIDAIKIAVLEVLKDAQVIGPKADEKLIDSTKIGTVEALRDTGMIKKNKPEERKAPSQSIPFKDLPPEGKVQMASQAGIQLDANQIRADEMADKIAEERKQDREFKLKEKQSSQKGTNAFRK